MLADEMGLGKTAQIVATFSELSRTHGVGGPFLVVAPLSTIEHWQRELNTWCPELRTVVLHGTAADRKVIFDHLWAAEAADDAEGGGGSARGGRRSSRGAAAAYHFHVVVTTYETLLRAEGAGRRLAAVPWQYVVIDEAQRLKNKEGATRDAVTALRHEQLALLTGTPVQNSVGELYSLLNLLDPRRFADADAFGDKFGHDGEPRTAAQLEALNDFGAADAAADEGGDPKGG